MTDPMERELKKALRRVEPPEGFTERVLARAAEEQAALSLGERIRAWFTVSQVRWATVAVMCLVLVAGYQYRVETRRAAKGEQAKEQVLLALQITARELHAVGEKVESFHSGRE